jgi:DNA-binding transcriptional ArsR family regulator
MVHSWLKERPAEAALFFSILGNEKRLAILATILDAEKSVGVIAADVNLSQSALSQHLAKLRRHGFVETRRDRQTIYYTCRCPFVVRIFDAMSELLPAHDPR